METLVDTQRTLFDLEPADEAGLLVKAAAMGEGFEWIAEDVLVIIIKTNSMDGVEESFNLEMAGKKMTEWVEMATQGTKQKVIFGKGEDNILDVIRPHLGNEKYTAVFYSDTPLLEKSTFLRVMEYVRIRTGNALRLLRGYVFNTAYAKTAKDIFSTVVEEFNRDNFLQVNSGEKFNAACDKLYDKIRKYHMTQGVIIPDAKSVYIGADVIIEPGAIIEPNNYIKGETYIGKNVKIGFGNVIVDSIISDGTVVTQSNLNGYKSDIGEEIAPFSVKGTKQ